MSLQKKKGTIERKFENESRSFEQFKEYQRQESDRKRRMRKRQENDERRAKEAEERKQTKKSPDGEEDGGGIVQIEMDEGTLVHPYHLELRTIGDLQRHLTRLLPKSQINDEKKNQLLIYLLVIQHLKNNKSSLNLKRTKMKISSLLSMAHR